MGSYDPTKYRSDIVPKVDQLVIQVKGDMPWEFGKVRSESIFHASRLSLSSTSKHLPTAVCYLEGLGGS